MDLLRNMGGNIMQYGVFYKFSHPTPNTLTLLAYDLHGLKHVPAHLPKIVDLTSKGAAMQVHAWFEWFGRKSVILVNSCTQYHHPLLEKILGKQLQAKTHPTVLDLSSMAMFLNLASPEGQEPIVNDDDIPATGMVAQRKFFKLQASTEIIPDAPMEYAELLDIVNVYVAHVRCMQTGAVVV
jgi:hypothetical protein